MILPFVVLNSFSLREFRNFVVFVPLFVSGSYDVNKDYFDSKNVSLNFISFRLEIFDINIVVVVVVLIPPYSLSTTPPTPY